MAGPSGGLEAPGSTDILDTTAAGAAAIRGAALRILGYGIGVGLSVVGAALLIRHLGPADFGRFTAAVSLVTIFATLAEAGMTNLGVREYSLLPPGRREAFVGGLAGLRIATTAVGVLVAVAIAVAVGYDGEMVAGTAIVGFGCLLLAAQSTWVVPLLTQLRLGWVTALELVRQAATVAATALFVIVGASLVPFFWVVAISTFAALLVTVPLVRGLVVFTPSLRDTDWRRLLALTIPFGAANAVGAVYAYLAVVLLSVISTEQQTGYFGASFRIFIVLAAVPGLLVASAFPILSRAARDDQSRLAYALRRLWEMVVLLGVGFALLTAVGAELAIDVVAGADFEPSVDVLRIQAIALLASFLLAVLGFALLSLSFYRGILIANAVALVVSLVVTLTLAPSYGAEGAAVATVLGEAALAAGYAITLIRRRPDLRPPLMIVPRVAAAVAPALAVVLVPGLSREVRLVAVAAVYAAAAWLVGAIPEEVVRALRSPRGQ